MAHPVLVRRVATVALPLALLAVPALPAAAAPLVTTVDVGSLGGPQTTASILNTSGQVAGQSKTAAGDYHAFFWSNGTITDLGISPGGSFSRAVDLNDAGQVLVTGDTATGSAAFRWQNGVATPIPAIGIGQVRVSGLNAAGTVIGYDVTTADTKRGFLWRPGQLTDLGPVVPALINDAGVVIGTVDLGGDNYRIVRWVAGVTTNLGTLGVAGGGQPYLTDLNEQGDIAAFASTGTGYKSYVRRAGATGWKVLGGLVGSTDVQVTALNERGDAAGISNTTGGSRRAVVWSDGVVRVLSTGGGQLSQAFDLNDTGSVAGAVTKAGQTRAVVWRAGVPVTAGPAVGDSLAGTLNASGQTVGSVDTLDDRSRGYRWTITG